MAPCISDRVAVGSRTIARAAVPAMEREPENWRAGKALIATPCANRRRSARVCRSRGIGVPANRISAIVSGIRGVTGETALRLARYFGTTAEYWINMQALYDLEVARDEFDAAIKQINLRTVVLGESYAHR